MEWDIVIEWYMRGGAGRLNTPVMCNKYQLLGHTLYTTRHLQLAGARPGLSYLNKTQPVHNLSITISWELSTQPSFYFNFLCFRLIINIIK